MFNRIAGTYDRANFWLSFGLDAYWRKRLISEIPRNPSLSILDLGTGTGDTLIESANARPGSRYIGVDPADSMLEIARNKSRLRNVDAEWVVGSALQIPLDDRSVDVITMSFAIRNVPDVNHALSDMVRCLKLGGKVCILEFSLPEFFLIRWGYLLYFRYILPFLGGLISGDFSAYRYLNRTVEAFPYGKEFAELMDAAGIKDVEVKPLTFGVATIYTGYIR